MSAPLIKHSGGCHCGRVRFEVLAPAEIHVDECNCSMCSKRGGLLWFAPREALRLSTPEAGLSTYRFNTMKIAHHFCPTCGIAPFGEGVGPDGASMAAVNVRCLEGVDVAALKIVQVDGSRF